MYTQALLHSYTKEEKNLSVMKKLEANFPICIARIKVEKCIDLSQYVFNYTKYNICQEIDYFTFVYHKFGPHRKDGHHLILSQVMSQNISHSCHSNTYFNSLITLDGILLLSKHGEYSFCNEFNVGYNKITLDTTTLCASPTPLRLTQHHTPNNTT